MRVKAWDSRLIGIQKELAIWQRSPVMGGGFGVTDIERFRRGEWAGSAFRHNTWTSTLAESGVFGFAAISALIFGSMVVGRRLGATGFSRATCSSGALAVITGCTTCSTDWRRNRSTRCARESRWRWCSGWRFARAMQLTEIRLLQSSYYPAGEEDPQAAESAAGGTPAPTRITTPRIPSGQAVITHEVRPHHRLQRTDRLRGRHLLRPSAAATSSASTTTCAPTSSAPRATRPGTSTGSSR